MSTGTPSSVNGMSSSGTIIDIIPLFPCLPDILSPMEILKKQKIGSIKIDKVDLDYSYDENYKPGIYFQIKNFLQDNHKKLCSIDEQIANISKIYNKIGNY